MELCRIIPNILDCRREKCATVEKKVSDSFLFGIFFAQNVLLNIWLKKQVLRFSYEFGENWENLEAFQLFDYFKLS